MSTTRGLIILAMGMITGGVTSLLPLEYSLTGIQWALPALGLGLGYFMYLTMGWRGVLMILLLGSWAIIMELIGTSTGWPYGSFEYHYALSREIWGLVPSTLGLIRPVLVLSMAAWVQDICDIRNTLMRILIGTLVLVGLDLFLDPIHVAQGIWSYADGGIWFGVPISNFLGRIWTGGVSMIITALLAKKPLPELLVASGWFMWGYFGILWIFLFL